MKQLAFRLFLVLLLQIGFFLGGVGPGSMALALTPEQQLYNEAWRIVSRSYLDDSFNDHNWWTVRQKTLRKRALAERSETYDAIQESLALLGDPFTRLMRPDQYRNLKVTTSGELTGVGLQVAKDNDSGSLIVIAPVQGSPAEAAGIGPRDRILQIDSALTQDLSLDDAATRMRGEPGSAVKLVIQKGEQTPQGIELIRERISLNPVSSALKQTARGRLGYLRLNQFNANATAEFEAAVRDLQQQGAEAFILDLRNNPGGLLQAGIAIARMWIDEGAIVYTADRLGILDSFQATHSALSDAPLVVLVNAGTASASEILAGALQDSGRAQLVGTTTFGKGLIQSLFELSDGSGMAVTVAKYETPAHHDINKLGIQPDLSIEAEGLRRDQLATEADPQYMAAIELLESGPAAIASPPEQRSAV
ncbi:MAG: PDZ domain-containing protein [Synechococcales cyanobacterium RM1_1_8]|nr:PDZ domain-containing protein [Synechococcales cyanobacterium RM1_1_8]